LIRAIFRRKNPNSIFHNGKTYHFRKAGTIIQAFNIQRVTFDFLLTNDLVNDAIREANTNCL